MRLCIISDVPSVSQTLATGSYAPNTPHRWAAALVQQGHQVCWVLSARHCRILDAEAVLAPAAPDTLPATCRYVVPVQPYRLGAIEVWCVDDQIWQHTELHTRLFTFLCLLQRALPCDVMHAWGTLAIAYLAVYTARLLTIPVAVSYDGQMRAAMAQQPFLWEWVARQVSAAVVPSRAERAQLLTCSSLTPAQIHVIAPAQPQVGQLLTALYARLRDGVRT